MTDHACLLLDKPLFRGAEAEGPYKGQRVLFVADPRITFQHIDAYVKDVDAVYLGAGRLTKVNPELLSDLLTKTERRVCVELGKAEDFLELVPVVNSYPYSSRLSLVLTVLMQTPDGVVAEFPQAFQLSGMLSPSLPDVSFKWDTGNFVRIWHMPTKQFYDNGFNDSEPYSQDTPLPPLVPL